MTDADQKNGQRIIGLTGGIATGKSTVSAYIGDRYGLPILDADVYAKEAVAKGSDILLQISDRYGAAVLLGDGTLNRAALGKIVFQNKAERRWLEDQIHPFVRRQFAEVTNSLIDSQTNSQTLVYAIPLLFEANLTHLVTEIWVVYCSPEQQKARLIARNHLSDTDAAARIAAQMPLKDKCDRADVVLDNSGCQAALLAQVDALF